MNDPLLPPISNFRLTEDEQNAIDFALLQKKPWKHTSKELAPVKDVLKAVKDKIRVFHMQRQKSKCCYCRMNLHGGGDFIIDREHIVPKAKYKTLTYVISNLSVACKRCNMQIKKDQLGFLINKNTILQNHNQIDQYLFIHPNYEKYTDFIKKRHVEDDDLIIIKYTKSDHPKALFTYEYFKLRSLEISSLDDAQGIEPRLDSEMKERFEAAQNAP